MPEHTVFGTYSAATRTDNQTGEMVTVAGWFAQDGKQITDPRVIARLEANMPKGTYKRGDAAEWLESNEIELGSKDAEAKKAWMPVTVYADQGNGVYLIRRTDGSLIGTQADRLRPADTK